MRVAIIGHRGTGKSSLLKRIYQYHLSEDETVSCLDLDGEIEARIGITIPKIFAEKGENGFREIEKKIFAELDQETSTNSENVYVAMGAGFNPKDIPESWKVLLVIRDTDQLGRIFLDRPRLDASISAIDEYFERYQRRHTAFLDRADDVLTLDEGIGDFDESEKAFILDRIENIGGAFTLLPSHFQNAQRLESLLKLRLKWGVQWVELRDDLLSEDQIRLALSFLPDDRALISFRDQNKIDLTRKWVTRVGLAFDWPLEFGECPFSEPRYLSLHERLEDQDLSEVFDRFPNELPEGTQLKAALPTTSFEELLQGHEWWQAEPNKRIFLPHSTEGRWNWYRLLQGHHYSLNFFRDSIGSGIDQPTTLQWIRRRQIEVSRAQKGEDALDSFAAILGDPVRHSWTPMEQRKYFAKKTSSVFAIQLNEKEWDTGAVAILNKMGLKWAAVTAPHKERAYKLCARHEVMAERLRSVNTIKWTEGEQQWVGTNTDIDGFKRTIANVSSQHELGSIAVWGGGGTLLVMESVLKTDFVHSDVRFFSLRTSKNRDDDSQLAKDFRPDTVIWAVGRSGSKLNDPPVEWAPALVIDLNYSDDSPGREFALKLGCRYIAGDLMFFQQAAMQRAFWDKSDDNLVTE